MRYVESKREEAATCTFLELSKIRIELTLFGMPSWQTLWSFLYNPDNMLIKD